MTAKWYDDPRLSPELRQRMADTNEMLRKRTKELEGDQAAEQAERDRINAEYRAAYLKGLANEKAVKQAERDAEFEASIAPTKRVKMLEWLVSHPGQTEKDFELVWPHVKELLKIGDRDELVRREVEAQRGRRY